MERIKLAIEKARAEGAQGVRSPGISPRHTEATMSQQAEAVLSSTVHASEAQPSASHPPVAVVTPDPAHLERHRIIAHQKSHTASWSFDVLRTQILQKMDEKGWRTLAITSPSVQSGKSLVAVNLAISLAQQPQRTALLVDFDLRRPTVAKLLDLHQPVSLNEVLSGEADMEQAMVSPGFERLVVLPVNRPMSYTSELLSSARVTDLVNTLRQRYEDGIVIFDLPPVLAADDVMAVVPHADCVLMVIGSGSSTKAEIDEAMTRLSRANLIGVLLNKDTAPAHLDVY